MTTSAEKSTAKSDTAVTNITTKYVTRINKLAQSECEGWIAMGRAISQYTAELKEKSERANPDVDRLLSEHPDSILHKSQIRNYRQSYELWEQLGGEGKAPKVSLTIFTVIKNANVNPGDVDKFLKMAEEEKLSVSELKARIKGREIEATESFSFNYKASLTMTKKGLTQALVSLGKIVSEKPEETVPAEVKTGILRLVQFSLSKGILSLSDVNAVAVEGGRNE